MSAKLLDLKPQRRDAILNAALKEFVLQGFDHASTNVIAKEAGISKALMFHYVSNKQELFLAVYDYFTQLLDEHYFDQMNFAETDLFGRLRQSYLLQLKLVRQYPCILEFSKLSTATNCNAVNQALKERTANKQSSCYKLLFDCIDISKFRSGLDIEQCKQFIYWSNIGFTNQLLDDMRNSKNTSFDEAHIVSILDGYFEELRKIFYQTAS